MTESAKEEPSVLYREIKGLLVDLRKNVKDISPWDKIIDLQRSDIRHKILHLLFTHPFTPQAQSIDGPLWLDTSHALIASYRQRMTDMDKFTSGNPTGPRRTVEMRRILHKFRTFLTSEENFWSSLALRLVRTYGLDEARPALSALNILSPNNSNPAFDILTQDPSQDDPIPPASPEVAPTLPPGQREKKLLLVHKVLICLGDLARYREQYNESGGRPKAGQQVHAEDWKIKKGRGGRKAGEVAPKPRDYTRAADCYQQARLLIPDNGNPSNQLAVLAVWCGDSFSSVYHCYRALCVRQPFPTAKDNLEKTLSKAFESRMKGVDKDRPASEQFKDAVVLLHALWLLRPGSSMLPKQSAKIPSALKAMVESRTLTSEIIVKTLVQGLGAHWHVRMFTQPLPSATAQQTQVTGDEPPNVTSSKHTEPLILTHILDVIRSLMEVGIREMQEGRMEAPLDSNEVAGEEEQVEHDHFAVAQRITAIFRRTLPALRIASKWLKSNIEYVHRASALPDISSADATPFDAFWSTYASFATSLTNTFPSEKLPILNMPLEEDIDMRGFAPLKRSMLDPTATQHQDGGVDVIGGVHPNEEQLMRIGDLLVDAMFIAQSEASSMYHRDGIFYSGKTDEWISTGFADPAKQVFIELDEGMELESDVSHRPALGDDDRDLSVEHNAEPGGVFDDGASESTRTDDDPVNLAMRATLGLDDTADDDVDDDDEQILYPVKRPNPASNLVSLTEQLAQTTFGSATSPKSPVLPPPNLENDFDTLPNVNTKPAVTAVRMSTTAEDLLAQALGGGASPASPYRQPSVMTPGRLTAPLPMVEASNQGFGRTLNQAGLPTQPLLFGGLDSVWGTGVDTAPQSRNLHRLSLGPASSAHNHGHSYSLSQTQISLPHQSWGRPHDMFSGARDTISASSSGSIMNPGDITSSPNSTFASPSHLGYMPGTRAVPFNPAPGSATTTSYSQVMPLQSSFSSQGSTQSNAMAYSRNIPPSQYRHSVATIGMLDPETQPYTMQAYPKLRQPSMAYAGSPSAARPWS
ncbi:hypothetical protein FRB99_004548 [Tulasnella sp. 403]|nr:hypothetical protein FRB99_004548 [Tulasnella sp. 403]